MVDETKNSSPQKDKTVVALGTFDGVHRGHQELLKRTAELARKRGLRSLAHTYELPPRVHLGEKEDFEAKLLLPPDRKLELLREYVEEAMVERFGRIRELEPRAFIEKILLGELRARAVVVGRDWRFGKNRAGDVEDLRSIGEESLSVMAIEPIEEKGEAISSTRIRRALKEGQMELAGRMLGRPPELRGKVTRGEGLGRKLGFPTANLAVDERLVQPGEGIYAARTEVKNRLYRSVFYVGTRPTIDDKSLRLEVHLLDGFNGSIYGERITVYPLVRLGGGRDYRSRAELRRAIEGFVQRAKEVL